MPTRTVQRRRKRRVRFVSGWDVPAVRAANLGSRVFALRRRDVLGHGRERGVLPVLPGRELTMRRVFEKSQGVLRTSRVVLERRGSRTRADGPA